MSRHRRKRLYRLSLTEAKLGMAHNLKLLTIEQRKTEACRRDYDILSGRIIHTFLELARQRSSLRLCLKDLDQTFYMEVQQLDRRSAIDEDLRELTLDRNAGRILRNIEILLHHVQRTPTQG